MQDHFKDRMSKLYGKYLSGDISREEYDELFDLMKKGSHQSWIEEMIDITLPAHLESPPLHIAKDTPSTPGVVQARKSLFRKKLVYGMSAAAAVLLLLTTVYLMYPVQEAQWVVYTTGYQETREVELPDGTTVVLNASSQLKHQDDFTESETRVVEFNGEGYFDVAHQAGKRFRVHTGSVEVNVLGTEFNLETRRDYANVFLKEGKVILETPELETVEMEPGDLVHYDRGKKEVKIITDQPSDSALSWKDGVFTFTELTGIQILEKMEDLYGKEFIIENPTQLRDVIVVQGLPYTDWDFTREALELALNVQFLDSTDNDVIVKEK